MSHIYYGIYVDMAHFLIDIHDVSVDVSLLVFSYLHAFTVFMFGNVFVAVDGKDLDSFET
jgi:hypothetical protein